jgi:hypothetical protein
MRTALTLAKFGVGLINPAVPSGNPNSEIKSGPRSTGKSRIVTMVTSEFFVEPDGLDVVLPFCADQEG